MPNPTVKGKFLYNGRYSTEFGIVISKVPTLSRPQRKFEIYQVPGRNGAVIEQLDAYDDIQVNYEVWFANEYFKVADAQKQAREIVAWLYNSKGYVRLEDDFEPEYYRLAYFNGSINIETDLCRYGTATITFTCRPERFLKAGEKPISITPTSPQTIQTIINPTAFTAKPLIHIEASTAGQVGGSIGTGSFLLNITDYLNIDCETQDCYRQPAENKNNMFTGSMPTLPSGDNLVNLRDYTGVISKIEITPRWWTL